MATYGDFPGVKVQTSGGGLSGVQVGSEEKLVIFGRGDKGNGSANVEEPTQIGARSDADNKFGSDTELANAMKDALANGANISYLYGVMLAETSVTGEDITAGSDAADHTGGSKISNAPLIEDASTITVQDDQSNTLDVKFKYETNTDSTNSDFTSLTPSSDTIFINPFTGEWVADASDNYNIDYEYAEWSSAFQADGVTRVVNDAETGVFCALSEAESVASDLESQVNTLRNNFQMVKAVAGAAPNSTGSDDGAEMNPGDYTDALDSDILFLPAPVRQDSTTETILGGVGGLFAGNAINNPIYNDTLSGYTGLEQKLTKSEADTLRGENLIPVRQAGSIRVKDNQSTSTSSDWERDFWRRRIVDRAILIGREVGESIIGRINTPETRTAAERTIEAELDSMANDNLIKDNVSDTTNYFVDVYQDSTNADEVNIDIGITPQGVVKRVDESITINT